MNRTHAILAITAALFLVACAPAAGGTQEAPTPAETPAPTPTPLTPAELPLTLRISGGFAGFDKTLEVETTGTWTFTDHRSSGPRSTGQLTDDQLAKLRKLLADPGLVNVPEDPGQGCADFVRYRLFTEARTVGNGPCGEGSPAFGTLIDFLSEVTAM